MKKKTVIIASAAGLILALGAAGITYAVTAPRGDTLTGETLERASNAALAEVGPGIVTSAERSDDGGPAFDLSVRRDNGDEVDVELNESFDVVWVGDIDRNDNNNGDIGYVPSTSPAPSVAALADDASTVAARAAQAAGEQATAEAAALAAVGSGRVTEFDRSDDADHRYEVEITLDNGQDIDVELDGAFTVVAVDDVRR
jgi:uncharacterized membrane protein YkoI